MFERRVGGGALFHLVSGAGLAFAALFCAAIATEIGAGAFPLWLAAAVAALGCLGFGLYSIRYDPWASALFAALSSGPAAVVAGVVANEGRWSGVPWFMVGASGVFLLSCAYIAWRKFGREAAPDLLGTENVAQLDGVEIRASCPEPRLRRGETAGLCLDLQNAWDARVQVQIEPVARGDALGCTTPSHVQDLEPGEAGRLWIPIRSTADAKPRVRLHVGVRVRRRWRLTRRLRRRPKPTLPLAPWWLIAFVTGVAGEMLSFKGLSIKLLFDPRVPPVEASPNPEAIWERWWVPDSPTEPQ